MIPVVSKKVLVQFVNLSEDDERYDKILEMLAAVTSQAVQEYLGYSMEQVTRVEFHQSLYADSLTPPGDDQLIWLGSRPVLASPPTEIKYSKDLGHDSTGAEVLVLNKDFVVDEDKGTIRVFPAGKWIFAEHPMGFKVTYKGGYEKINAKWSYLNVPAEIMTATAMQTAFFFHSHMRGSIGFGNNSDSASSPKSDVKEPLDTIRLLPEVRLMLAPFIRTSRMIGVRK